MRHTRVTGALLCAAAMIACLVSVVRAQQQPTFRGGIELVEVDAIVTDGRGRPVKDLTPADFEILEDGRPQPVSTFAFVDIPLTPVATALEAAEPDITTNTSEKERRLWVMLLDTPVVEINAFARGATYTRLTQNVARRFIDEAVGPAAVFQLAEVGELIIGNGSALAVDLEQAEERVAARYHSALFRIPNDVVERRAV